MIIIIYSALTKKWLDAHHGARSVWFYKKATIGNGCSSKEYRNTVQKNDCLLTRGKLRRGKICAKLNRVLLFFLWFVKKFNICINNIIISFIITLEIIQRIMLCVISNNYCVKLVSLYQLVTKILEIVVATVYVWISGDSSPKRQPSAHVDAQQAH